MNQNFLKTVWVGVMFGVLMATAPVWLNRKPADVPGYDAPWVYPAYNPVVQGQLSRVSSANFVIGQR